MKSRRFFANEAGFTLMEALIAIAIFSIGLLAVGALQARALRDTGDVARKTEAWTLADEQVTLLKNMPFYANPAAQAFPPDLDENGGGFAHMVNRQMNGSYDVHWMVEDDVPLAPVNTTAVVLAGLPAGTFTVSKRITVVVTLQGDNPLTEPLAEVQFIKAWAATDL